MATVGVPSPALAAAPTSMQDAIHQVLSDPAPTNITPPEPVTPPPDPLPPAAAAPATPETEPAPPADVVAPSPDDPITGPDSKSEDGRRWFFDRSKGERLISTSTAMDQMREVVPDLSVDTLRQIVDRSQAASVMVASFHKASDPQAAPQDRISAMDDVVDFFAEQSPVSLGVMTVRALNKLPQVNPQAHQAVTNQFNNQLLANMRARISQIIDPTLQQQEIGFVQNLEQRMTGRYTKAEDLIAGRGGAQSQQRTPDPANADLQRREEAIRQREVQFQNQAAQELQTHILNSEENAIQGVIESTLAQVKGRVDPEYYKFLTQQIRQEVRDAEDAHPEWGGQYKALLTQAKLTGQPLDIQRLSDYRKQITRQVMRAKAGEYITKASSLFTKQGQPPVPPNTVRPNGEPSLNGVGTPANPNGLDQIQKASNWKDMFQAAALGQR